MTAVLLLLAASSFADTREVLLRHYIERTVRSAADLHEAERDMAVTSASGDLVLWRRTHAHAAKLEKEVKRYSREAIKLAVAYYEISPGGLSYGHSDVAKEGPRNGLRISWEPVLENPRQRYFRYQDSQGQTRYYGPFGIFEANDEGGTTWPDGKVTIDLSMFQQANKEGPGVLAYILHHEARHFEDKLQEPELTKEQGEVDAYTASAEAAERFKLGPDWTAKFKAKIETNQYRIDRGLARSRYLTAEEEAAIRDRYQAEQQALLRQTEEEQRLKREASEAAHIQRLELLCAEACRRRLSSDDFKDMRRELSAEQYEAQRRFHEKQQMAPPSCKVSACIEIFGALQLGRVVNLPRINLPGDIKRLIEEAQTCGLSTLQNEDGSIYGFADAHGAEYHFDSPRRLAPIRLNMLMIHACSMAVYDPAWSEERDYEPICNSEGFAAVQRNIDPLGLKVYPASRDRYGWVDHCVQQVFGADLQAEMSVKDYKKAVRKLVRRYDEARDNEAAAENSWAEARRVAEEERLRAQREPREPRVRPGRCLPADPNTGIVGCIAE